MQYQAVPLVFSYAKFGRIRGGKFGDRSSYRTTGALVNSHNARTELNRARSGPWDIHTYPILGK